MAFLDIFRTRPTPEPPIPIIDQTEKMIERQRLADMRAVLDMLEAEVDIRTREYRDRYRSDRESA